LGTALIFSKISGYFFARIVHACKIIKHQLFTFDIHFFLIYRFYVFRQVKFERKKVKIIAAQKDIDIPGRRM